MADTMIYGDGTNSTSGANTQTHFYDRAGIKAATTNKIYVQFADRKSMPSKRGRTFKISRWQHSYDRQLADSDFAKHGFFSSRSLEDVSNGINNAKLSEGSGRKNLVDFKKVTLSADFSRYGEMIEYTDEVELFSEDTIKLKYKEELGERANRIMEDLIQLDMLGTGNVIYSGLATNLATMGNGLTADATLDDNYRISYDFIRKCVKKLVRNRAEKNTEAITGSVKIDTRTINRSYYAIIGSEVKYDLENTTKGKNNTEEFAYIPVYKYTNGVDKLADGEVGCLHEVRFIESESALVYKGKGAEVPNNYVGTLSYTGTIGTDAKFDVFPVLFPTKGSFATIGLGGMDKVIFREQDPNKTELSNPYGTKGFHSYNFWYAGIILQEEKLLKGLVCATA